MYEPVRRRKRPTKSCLLCRKRKLRCDRELPCSNCQKSKTGSCQYMEGEGPTGTGRRDTAEEPHTPVSVISAQAPLPGLERAVVEWPKHSDLSRVSPSPEVNIEEHTNPLAGTWHIYTNKPPTSCVSAVTSGFVHKTRFFGPSHWATSGVSLTLDAYTKAAARVDPGVLQATLDVTHKCKSYGRLIKTRRMPTWPCLPTSTLPPRPLADTLLSLYRRSFESLQRILHMPTFLKDYDDLFNGLRNDMGFIMQVKLVLAIGAITYDDTFSLRSDAIRWTCEAHCWLMEPRFKSRLALQNLQTQALLITAHEHIGLGGDPTCISAAALLRKAVHMGLHRDPKHLPKKSLSSAEMRRRIWSVIVEMNVHSSLASGIAPTLSASDFDAEPPGNYDDDQLMSDGAKPAPLSQMTDSTVTVILQQSCMDRLGVVKYLNDLHSQYTFGETMRHDAKIRAAYRSAMKQLQTAIANTGHPEEYLYQVRQVELIFCRFLMALHAPFFPLALKESQYAFCRKAVVDASTKVWSLVFPSSELHTPASMSSMSTTTMQLLYRMLTCSSGHFGIAARHASHLLAVECRSLLEEQDSLGPLIVRQDLMATIAETKKWSYDTLEAGRVSIRGLQLICGVEAQIQSILQQESPAVAAESIIQSAEKSAALALPILKRKAAELGNGSEQGGLAAYQQEELGHVDIMDDWGFMTAEPMLLPADGDALNWMLGADEHDGW